MGGLPVIAAVWYSGPDWQGEYDEGVDALYWPNRDGTRGKQLSQSLMDKIAKKDPYWEGHVCEQVGEYFAMQDWLERGGEAIPPVQLTFAEQIQPVQR